MAESVSPRRLEGNRRNTLRSTGPTSAAGKARVSRNALKDGLFANKFLIVDGDAREDRDAYEALQRGLEADFQPVEFIDRLNVRRLGNELWRLDRVAAAEQGAIRKRADDLIAAEAERRRREFEDDKNHDPANLKRTSLGLQFLIDELDGFFTEVPHLDLTRTPPLPLEQLPEPLAQDLAPLQQAVKAQAPEDAKAFVLRALRRLRAKLTRDLGSARERDDMEVDGKRARFMLPATRDMDRILRAKTAAERSADRLQQRLQPLKDARTAAERAATRPRATVQ